MLMTCATPVVVVVITLVPGVIGMTGPCGCAGKAPQLWHCGIGGMVPYHIVGTVTAPPQMEQVPIVVFIILIVITISFRPDYDAAQYNTSGVECQDARMESRNRSQCARMIGEVCRMSVLRRHC